MAMDLFSPNISDQQADGGKNIYSVSKLNKQVKNLLETGFGTIWLSGEVSNFSRPSSGHWYFSLKDESAQVRCAMFRGQNQRMAYTPKNGDNVLIRAKISVYEPRGEYQLIANHIEPMGTGDLQQAFEALKNKLHKEGLFNADVKQDIPTLAQYGFDCVGIITSATGAAVRDVLSVMKRRYPKTRVIIYPVPVQGEHAPPQIVNAIQTANQRQECDCLLLVRGGGSIEDLWAFNDETVARAIYASKLPTVSGVGHETDFTICDFVADRRAPTPSVAGEMVTPHQDDMLNEINSLNIGLKDALRRTLERQQQTVDNLETRINSQHPVKRIRDQYATLAQFETRLNQHIKHSLQAKQHNIDHARTRLLSHHPNRQLGACNRELSNLHERLIRAITQKQKSKQQALALCGAKLNAVSPLNTLERGYSVIFDPKGHVISNANNVKSGDAIEIKLAHGSLEALVQKTKP